MLNVRGLTRHKKARFVLVGILNTAVDFTVYATLRQFMVSVFVANLVSTSCGMTVSYTLNRTFTFASTAANRKRQVALFLIVTLAGLWVLQPAIILLVLPVLRNMGIHADTVSASLLPKLVATAATLTWNYFWYHRVVFAETKTGPQLPHNKDQ